MSDRVFAALLRYWRGRRGLSQLDLALAADVSARHVSWLESGRSRPSRTMVLRLMTTLDVPLRAVDEALEAAGFSAQHQDDGPDDLPAVVGRVLDRMMAQQEPYPLTVLGPDYTVVRANRAARALFARLAPGAPPVGQLTVADLLFDPALARPVVRDWPAVARAVLSRWHREALQCGDDERLWAPVRRALAHPGVPESWCRPDFSVPPASTLELWFEPDGPDGEALGFLTAVTVFSQAGRITLEEIRIESWFPLDEATLAACERLRAGPG